MPVPKEYQERYGMIVGKLINDGYSKDIAKKKADQAISDLQKKGKKKK